MERNEPSTAEIVSFLMEMPESTFWSYTRVGKVSHEEIAACIKRLERENGELRESNGRLAKAVAELTETAGAAIARAENAEAERDAADNGSYDLYKRFESISDEVREESPSCKLCGNFPESCAVCLKYNAFKLRGLR